MSNVDVVLYPHNQDTYAKIIDAWRVDNRVAVVQATGTGKSYIILKCMSNFLYQRKIVLAPSHYIINQLKKDSGGGYINTTYLTYSKLAFMTNSEIEGLKPSLIVLDEFHRCGAEVWGIGVKKLISANPDAKLLGTSATPIRYLDNERDMSDELFEGRVVTNLSLAQAIVEKILPMPKYITALYSLDEEELNLKRKINSSGNSKGEKKKLLSEVENFKRKLNKSKGAKEVLKKHIDTKSGKFIVFCKDVSHLEEMKIVLKNWFSGLSNNIEILSLYNGFENGDAEFEYFRDNDAENSIMLLLCIDMLNEGIHIDDVTGVLLLRPTFSPVIFYQQIGRAIMVGESKNPLIFDFVNNFSNIGTNRFLSDLKDSQREMNYRVKGEIDVPEFLIFDEIQEIRMMFSSIEDRLIADWDDWYDKLVEFWEANGHVLVQRTKENLNTGLGKWVSRQRQYYNSGMLEKEKIDKLELLGFAWDLSDHIWNQMYSLVCKYKEVEGHIETTISEELFEGENIHRWMNRQRVFYNSNTISSDKIDKLNEIGFVWSSQEKIWRINMEKLIDFKEKNGHITIPKKEDSSLYTWLYKQKKKYKNGELSEVEMAELDSVGLTLKSANELVWDERFEKYKSATEGRKVRYVLKSEDESLWSWANAQRLNYKNNKALKEYQIEKLNSIEFLWNEDGGRIYIGESLLKN